MLASSDSQSSPTSRSIRLLPCLTAESTDETSRCGFSLSGASCRQAGHCALLMISAITLPLPYFPLIPLITADIDAAVGASTTSGQFQSARAMTPAHNQFGAYALRGYSLAGVIARFLRDEAGYDCLAAAAGDRRVSWHGERRHAPAAANELMLAGAWRVFTSAVLRYKEGLAAVLVFPRAPFSRR